MPQPPALVSARGRRRVALYVRMSTDQQKNSIEQQVAVLTEYANAEGMEIVRTYADEGRSGLSTRGRSALAQLLADAEAGPPFSDLLVYDVSRWGRYQDCDEAAFYEFICRRAGVNVRYVAEPFENDGSAMSSIVKGMKRVMAAEYSRDLSRRVQMGKARVAAKGHWTGGRPPYGYRRISVSADGRRRCVLEDGERKRRPTDHVVVCPGPPERVEVVRQIFVRYVRENMSVYKIAERLTAEGVIGVMGGKWTGYRVITVLTNRVYIGDYVYKNVMTALRARWVKGGPDEYACAEGVFEPIIERPLFDRAQVILGRYVRPGCYTDEQLLAQLRALSRRKGTLSTNIVNADRETASHMQFINRFGSFMEALRLAGCPEAASVRYRTRLKKTETRDQVVTEIVTGLTDRDLPSARRGRDTVETGSLSISVLILVPSQWHGGWVWGTCTKPSSADFALLTCLEGETGKAREYFLVPAADLPERMFLYKQRLGGLARHRIETFDRLFALAELQARLPSQSINPAADPAALS